MVRKQDRSFVDYTSAKMQLDLRGLHDIMRISGLGRDIA